MTQSHAQQVAIFVVSGTVYWDEVVAEDSLTVVVTNTKTGASDTSYTGSTGDLGVYAVTFADLLGGRAATVDDEIKVEVYDAEEILLRSVTYTVTSEDIERANAEVDVVLPPKEFVDLTTWGEIKQQLE